MNASELKQRLDREGFRGDAYRLDGGTSDYEGLVLKKKQEGWSVEYFERGFWSSLGEFQSEEKACA